MCQSQCHPEYLSVVGKKNRVKVTHIQCVYVAIMVFLPV